MKVETESCVGLLSVFFDGVSIHSWTHTPTEHTVTQGWAPGVGPIGGMSWEHPSRRILDLDTCVNRVWLTKKNPVREFDLQLKGVAP